MPSRGSSGSMMIPSELYIAACSPRRQSFWITVKTEFSSPRGVKTTSIRSPGVRKIPWSDSPWSTCGSGLEGPTAGRPTGLRSNPPSVPTCHSGLAKPVSASLTSRRLKVVLATLTTRQRTGSPLSTSRFMLLATRPFTRRRFPLRPFNWSRALTSGSVEASGATTCSFSSTRMSSNTTIVSSRSSRPSGPSTAGSCTRSTPCRPRSTWSWVRTWGWYQYSPASGMMNSYSNVSPGCTGCCAMCAPSWSAGISRPCQWMVVGSSRSLVKWTLRRSPTLARMVGPGTWPLYAHTVVSTPGVNCQVDSAAVRSISITVGSGSRSTASAGSKFWAKGLEASPPRRSEARSGRRTPG